MTALQTTGTRDVARPLQVLTPLIKSDVENGDQAGMQYYVSAGEKLIEAKEGHYDGDAAGFWRYAEKTTGKSKTTITTWMLAGVRKQGKPFKSLAEVEATPKHLGGKGINRQPVRRREYIDDIDPITERARREAFRLIQDEALTKAQERDAERALAHRLIDIGWKVLAKELHPDKVGGSRDAMKRLNSVRDKLKHAI